jgi:hypothetical protein
MDREAIRAEQLQQRAWRAVRFASAARVARRCATFLAARRRPHPPRPAGGAPAWRLRGSSTALGGGAQQADNARLAARWPELLAPKAARWFVACKLTFQPRPHAATTSRVGIHQLRPWATAPEPALPLPPPLPLPPLPPAPEAPAAAPPAADRRSCLPPLRAALQAGLCSFQWAFWQAVLRRVGAGAGMGASDGVRVTRTNPADANASRGAERGPATLAHNRCTRTGTVALHPSPPAVPGLLAGAGAQLRRTLAAAAAPSYYVRVNTQHLGGRARGQAVPPPLATLQPRPQRVSGWLHCGQHSHPLCRQHGLAAPPRLVRPPQALEDGAGARPRGVEPRAGGRVLHVYGGRADEHVAGIRFKPRAALAPGGGDGVV